MYAKIKEYLLTTIGVALTAIALEYFFFPCDIAGRRSIWYRSSCK